MSLRSFHTAFIVAAGLFSAGFGIWALREFTRHHRAMELGMGIGSLLIATALAIYLPRFLRKTQDLPA